MQNISSISKYSNKYLAVKVNVSYTWMWTEDMGIPCTFPILPRML
jgi:hypothetical protein